MAAPGLTRHRVQLPRAGTFGKPRRRWLPPGPWLSMRVLRALVMAAAGWPLLVLSALYVNWLLSWWCLGFRPVARVHDPKWIDGANWMHWLAGWAVVAIPFVAFCGLVLNWRYEKRAELRGWARVRRQLGLAAPWVAMVLVAYYDPGQVVRWFFD